MSLRKNHLLTVSLACTLGLAACSSDTAGPGDGEFDAVATATDLDAVNATFATDAFQSLAVLGNDFGMPAVAMASASAGLTEIGAPAESSALTDRAMRSARELSAALSTTAAGAPVLPQEYWGNTYVYSELEGQYVLGEGVDAPDTGVRFELYAVNPITEDIALPLTPIGYVDIIDLNPASDTQVAIQVVVVSGEVTYVDYTVSAELGTGGGISATVGVAGMITDGETTANFDLTATADLTFAGGDFNIDYTLDVPVLAFGITVDLDVTASEAGGTANILVIVTHEGNFVRVSGTLMDEAGTLEVHVGAGSGETGGDLFATITTSPTGFSVVGGDGQPLSQDEIDTLEEIVNVFEDAFDVFEDLFHPVDWIFQQ